MGKLNGKKCPNCKHPDVKFIKRWETWLKIFECEGCKHRYWWGK